LREINRSFFTTTKGTIEGLLPLLLLPQNQRVDVGTFAGSVSVLVAFVAVIGVAAVMAVAVMAVAVMAVAVMAVAVMAVAVMALAVMAVAVIAAAGNTAVVAAGSVSV
jgi:hypothetical protein